MRKDERRAAVRLELARLIGEERKRRGLSKNEMATLTGLNQSTTSRLENHPDNPTLDSLQRVAEALGISLGALLEKAEKKVAKAG